MIVFFLLSIQHMPFRLNEMVSLRGRSEAEVTGPVKSPWGGSAGGLTARVICTPHLGKVSEPSP